MGRNGRRHYRLGLSRPWLSAAVLAGCGLLAACGSAAPQTFKPGAGSASPSTQPAATQSAGTSAARLVVPPFGHGAHVVMTPWRPASPADAAAVLTAKDFVLAVLYADYTGDTDHRWRQYVGSSRVQTALAATLDVPSVTTESFAGTVRFWRMTLIPAGPGRVEVTECVDTARAKNTSLRTGRDLPRRLQVPAGQNFYSNSDVLAKAAGGQWRVVSIPATIYYPQAQECKP